MSTRAALDEALTDLTVGRLPDEPGRRLVVRAARSFLDTPSRARDAMLRQEAIRGSRFAWPRPPRTSSTLFDYSALLCVSSHSLARRWALEICSGVICLTKTVRHSEPEVG